MKARELQIYSRLYKKYNQYGSHGIFAQDYAIFKEFVTPEFNIITPKERLCAEVQIDRTKYFRNHTAKYFQGMMEFYPYIETRIQRNTLTSETPIVCQAEVLNPETYNYPEQSTQDMPEALYNLVEQEEVVKPSEEMIIAAAQLEAYKSDTENTIRLEDYIEELVELIEPYLDRKAVAIRLDKALDRITDRLNEAIELVRDARKGEYHVLETIESEIYGILEVICRSYDSQYPPAIEFQRQYRKNRGNFKKRPAIIDTDFDNLRDCKYSIFFPTTRIIL